MRRGLVSIAGLAVLVSLVVSTPSATAGQGGYNRPTNLLEKVFKVALFYRPTDDRGCYPSPKRLVKLAKNRANIKIGIARSDNSRHRSGKVYVIRRQTSCDRLHLSLRGRPGLYILDSNVGPVYLRGHRGPSQESLKLGRGPLRNVTVVDVGGRVLKPDLPQRFDLRCPGKSSPIGGGMVTTVDPDGEGAYPHSFERLGVQRGYHVSAVLLDPAPRSAPSRALTIQAICARGVVPTASPHKTVFIRRGETKTVTARCPRGTRLFSGGFQRNNWISTGGAYVTESKANGNAWTVTGSAFARWGGEMTAIAYCAKQAPEVTEVQASAPIPSHTFKTVNTPTCPPGTTIGAGGFSSNGSPNAFIATGFVNPDGGWSSGAYAYFGDVPSYTAYGYCLRPGTG